MVPFVGVGRFVAGLVVCTFLGAGALPSDAGVRHGYFGRSLGESGRVQATSGRTRIPGYTGTYGDNDFGTRVALSADGNTALVGGPAYGADGQGAAWIFTRNGSSWAQQGSKLTASGVSRK